MRQVLVKGVGTITHRSVLNRNVVIDQVLWANIKATVAAVDLPTASGAAQCGRSGLDQGLSSNGAPFEQYPSHRSKQNEEALKSDWESLHMPKVARVDTSEGDEDGGPTFARFSRANHMDEKLPYYASYCHDKRPTHCASDDHCIDSRLPAFHLF